MHNTALCDDTQTLLVALTITRLTRETALALIPARAMQPSMWTMIISTEIMMIKAAQRLRPIVRNVTKNTAPVGEAMTQLTA